jgi:hypothetical protein
VPERALSDLAREITAGAVRLAAATAAWLRLVAEFDRREGWEAYGIRSCAHWLSWQCGMAPGTAREHVRVARALADLPLIAAAFTEGRLSFSKVRALTRIADPHTEDSLLEFALEATASQVERTVREWRRADAVDEETIVARRQFETWWDDDGMLEVRLRLDPEEGAALLTAVDSRVERSVRRERAERKRRTDGRDDGPEDDGPDDAAADGRDSAEAAARTTARRCTALVRLCEAGLDADRRAGDPPRREVVVHVDADVLADDAAAGRAHLEGGPALHASQVRRMLCEAALVVMLERGREVLAHGRRQRLATRSQRRALLRRDGGCARPGCPERRIERLHAHHMRHWLHGGPTDLDNLVLLCDADHGLAHELDLVMARRDGRLIVTAPDGRRVWGPADAAFTVGLGAVAGVGDPFTGVHPIDDQVGRRPLDASTDRVTGRDAVAVDPAPARGRDEPAAGAAGRRMTGLTEVTRLLFPEAVPDLPDAMGANGERMDLAYVVGVLMGNRDLDRRLRAEASGVSAGMG